MNPDLSPGEVIAERDTTLHPSIRTLVEDERLTPSERSAWRRQLTGLRNECGCHAGAIGLLGAVPVLAALLLLGAPGGLPRFALVVGLPVVGALGGKAVGLLRAQLRFRSAVIQLNALLTPRATAEVIDR